MSKYIQKLKEVFELMENDFSSRDFSIELHKKGVPPSWTACGNIANYLHPRANQITQKTWRKKTIYTNIRLIDTPINVTNELPLENRITECISFLKSHGYKVLRPTTEFKEV